MISSEVTTERVRRTGEMRAPEGAGLPPRGRGVAGAVVSRLDAVSSQPLTHVAGPVSGLRSRLREWFALDDDWVRPTPPIGRADVLLFAVIEVLGLVFLETTRSLGAFEHTSAPKWLQWFALSSGVLLLVARRRFPLSIGMLAALHMFVVGVSMPAVMGQASLQVVYFIAILSAVAWSRSRAAALGVVSLIVLLMFVWVAWGLAVGSGIDSTIRETGVTQPQGLFGPATAVVVATMLINATYFAGAVLGGQMLWRSARQRARLAEQAATISDQAESLRARAVLDERLRIARELHDVVGHHVSVIGVQAAGARRVMGSDPEAAAGALAAVEASSREAVTQMRSLLGTLREMEARSGPDSDAAVSPTGSRAPEPGLADLPALVADPGENGLDVRLELVEQPDGAAGSLSGPQQLTLYRVVQEALANVRRHSSARSASVTVRVMADPAAGEQYAEVEILDDGRPLPGTSGSGLGQLGIRERAASHHGRLEIGPRPMGGYRVRLRIPLGDTHV